MPLECQTIQDARTRKQRLVATAPRTGDDDSVDQARNRLDTCSTGSNNKRTLRGGSALITQARVVARHQHAHNEHRKHVKQQDAKKDLLAGARDGAARVLGFGGGHGDRFDAGKGEDGAGHDAPEAEKFTPVAGGDVLDKGAWVLPVEKADARRAGDAAEVDY